MKEIPKLGELVKFNVNAKYQEWNDGSIWRVVALKLENDGKTVDVTIARPNLGHNSHYGWEEPTDGFRIEEIDYAALSYGLCPTCHSPGMSRERRWNGNDQCERGHVYPSNTAII